LQAANEKCKLRREIGGAKNYIEIKMRRKRQMEMAAFPLKSPTQCISNCDRGSKKGSLMLLL